MPVDRNSIAYSYVPIVLALLLPEVTLGYYLSIFAFMFIVQCLTVAGVSQSSSNAAGKIRNSQEPESYLVLFRYSPIKSG